jgi:RNA polymerase sigma factor (sigma-70 family)
MSTPFVRHRCRLPVFSPACTYARAGNLSVNRCDYLLEGMTVGRPQRGLATAAASAEGRLGRSRGFEEFEALVVPFVLRLHRFLVMRLGDERDARDALQETLLAAWQGLPQLREKESPWPWLAGIAAHKASDSARRRFRSVPLSTVEEPYREDDSAELLGALERLPAAAREVLLLRYLLRLSEAEVADVLGVRVGTVKSRAARARQRLLEELR